MSQHELNLIFVIGVHELAEAHANTFPARQQQPFSFITVEDTEKV